MRFFDKNRKKNMINAFAGITAVCISPTISGLIINHVGHVSDSVGNAIVQVMSLPVPEQVGPLLINPVYPDRPGYDDINDKQILRTNEYDKSTDNLNTGSEGENTNKGISEKPDGVMSFNMSEFKDDISVYDGMDGKIIKNTYLPIEGDNYINLKMGGQVRNTTDLPNTFVRDVVNTPPDIKLDRENNPEVLIIHTHTSESFQPPESRYYDGQYSNRSIDSNNNVVSVGAEIANVLSEYGISAIHDGTIHDFPEYSDSYNRSAVTASELLRMNPSIKIVLDIHRDAISEGNAPVAAVTDINGKPAAQVMIISAADDGNYDIPNYLENLKLAAYLQERMERDNPGITRPVLFQYCHYNQDLSTGSLLFEIGSHGNTIDEAVYTGRLIGESIAKALAELQ
ncbi:MAG: stage II sporulation protein P [Eubacterium sp.]|nr:stage II sporulation protein P [Eubacterium sp.]